MLMRVTGAIRQHVSASSGYMPKNKWMGLIYFGCHAVLQTLSSDAQGTKFLESGTPLGAHMVTLQNNLVHMACVSRVLLAGNMQMKFSEGSLMTRAKFIP